MIHRHARSARHVKADRIAYALHLPVEHHKRHFRLLGSLEHNAVVVQRRHQEPIDSVCTGKACISVGVTPTLFNVRDQ